MFGITTHLEKIYKIKWKFDEKFVESLEKDLYVEFEKRDDYFQIKKVLYSYIDILLGLEDINFTFTKKDDEYIMTLNL